jgi:hypothetical protein
MKTIDDHINQDATDLYDPGISSQRRRFLEQELEDLKAYKEHHPEDAHDPTPLELYCDKNPDALECRIYDN